MNQGYPRSKGIPGMASQIDLVPYEELQQISQSDVTALLGGETGSGKGRLARQIHAMSRRAGGPFVAVDCAALPASLFESQLFGSKKGAFTGATTDRIGLIRSADGGTLFLDEVGDMALPTQTKILRAIQEGEIQRVGGSSPIQVNVRVIAATNRDIEDMVKTQDFREDLYYRLNVFRIRIPPLRERREDIPEIIDYHLQRLVKQKKIRARTISEEALEVMKAQPWNGNVRELENVVYRSAVVAQGGTIFVTDLPSDLENALSPDAATDEGSAPQGGSSSSDGVDDASGEEVGKLYDELFSALSGNADGHLLQVVEHAMIRRAMKHVDNNQAKAASLLGISKSTLRTRLSLLRSEESKSDSE